MENKLIENDTRQDHICQQCGFHTVQYFLLGKWICGNCARPQKETKKEEVCKR
jgi:ribosomal protein L37AE/L43A